MAGTFENKVAVITGAASGLGWAIAQELLAQGATVALLDQDVEALNNLQLPEHGHYIMFAVDVTDEVTVKTTIQAIHTRFGAIHILINSAGIVGKTNMKSHEVPPKNVAQVMDVNFTGSFLTSKYCLPYMLAQDYGRILHIASIAGKEGNAGMLAYSASKAAVIAMTKVQGKEYAGTGITVNALAPTVIRTAMVAQMPTDQVTYMTDKIPMKRCGTLKELVHTALFIVSEETSFSTGFTFDLSGGRATY